MLYAYSDASVRNDKTGLGYCINTRLSNGEIGTVDDGYKTLDCTYQSVEAEYLAVLLAVEKAAEQDGTEIMVYTDCSAVAEAIHGCKNEYPYGLYRKRFIGYVEDYDYWYVYWLPSDQNERAHLLSRMGTGGWA